MGGLFYKIKLIYKFSSESKFLPNMSVIFELLLRQVKCDHFYLKNIFSVWLEKAEVGNYAAMTLFSLFTGKLTPSIIQSCRLLATQI